MRYGRLVSGTIICRALVGSIVSQQLSTKAAATIFGRFVALFPDGQFLSARPSLRKRDGALRGVGLSGQKVSYLRDLGARIIDGRLISTSWRRWRTKT